MGRLAFPGPSHRCACLMLPQHILAPSTSYQTCIQTSAVHTKNANTIVLHSGYKNAITPVYSQCTSPKMRTLPYCAPQKCEPLSGTLQDYGPTTPTRNANSDLWHRQIYWGCAFKKCGGCIQKMRRAYKYCCGHTNTVESIKKCRHHTESVDSISNTHASPRHTLQTSKMRTAPWCSAQKMRLTLLLAGNKSEQWGYK